MAEDQTLAQLDAYYELNVRHLKWSFWSSLAALFIGLASLTAGVALVLTGRTEFSSYLTIVGGAFAQSVSAGFFVLYSRNLTQLNVFYEKLVKHKDTLYAISIAREVPEQKRTEALMAVIGALLSRGEPPMSPELLTALAKKQ
jgi:hypothetical protein